MHFNPPAPCGAGQRPEIYLCTTNHFNPPAPCGAGLPEPFGNLPMVKISIHPPLAGRDDTFPACCRRHGISIHPPLAGRDRCGPPGIWARQISIHPPLAGRDHERLLSPVGDGDFNPPAPCGAGRSCGGRGSGGQDFNPPAPCGAGQRSCTKKLCKTSHIAQKVHLPWPY